jgi:hypothetical protein
MADSNTIHFIIKAILLFKFMGLCYFYVDTLKLTSSNVGQHLKHFIISTSNSLASSGILAPQHKNEL